MIDFLISQAAYAHFYIFGLFMLAGFCVPVSEDVMFIAAAVISVTLVPENREVLFAACFAGFVENAVAGGDDKGFFAAQLVLLTICVGRMESGFVHDSGQGDNEHSDYC